MATKNNKFNSQKKNKSRFSKNQDGQHLNRPKFQKKKSSTMEKSNFIRKSDFRTVLGQHSILEILKVRPHSIFKALVRSDWREHSHSCKIILDLLRNLSIETVELNRVNLDKEFPGNQGIVLFAEENPTFEIDKIKYLKRSTLLLLDGLEDPHNLGAIIRTAWLTKVQGIIIPNDRAVSLTPTVHKVACGGVEHVPILQTSHFAGPIEEFKKSGFWVFGLSDKASKNLYNLNIPEKVIWCIGSEDRGLRSSTENLCDELVAIPQVSAGASFNASVAAGITLGETVRQQVHHSNE